jgi:hypothetical protein
MDRSRMAVLLKGMDENPESARHMIVTAKYGKEDTVLKALTKMPEVTGVYSVFGSMKGPLIADNNMAVGVKTGDDERYRQAADKARNIDGVSYVTELNEA